MTRTEKAPLRSGFMLLGPAFVAAIAYVDPGNVAANVSAGAQFGFLLVWVIVLANVMAGLVQFLSAKLGLVTGRSLPEAVADNTRRSTRIAYWLQAELVAMATISLKWWAEPSPCICCSISRCCWAASSPAQCRWSCSWCRTSADSECSSGSSPVSSW